MSDTPEKIIPTNEMLVMLCADLEADGMLNSAVIRRWSAWLRRAGQRPTMTHHRATFNDPRSHRAAEVRDTIDISLGH